MCGDKAAVGDNVCGVGCDDIPLAPHEAFSGAAEAAAEGAGVSAHGPAEVDVMTPRLAQHRGPVAHSPPLLGHDQAKEQRSAGQGGEE